jgi:hypothetical protein
LSCCLLTRSIDRQAAVGDSPEWPSLPLALT